MKVDEITVIVVGGRVTSAEFGNISSAGTLSIAGLEVTHHRIVDTRIPGRVDLTESTDQDRTQARKPVGSADVA